MKHTVDTTEQFGAVIFFKCEAIAELLCGCCGNHFTFNHKLYCNVFCIIWPEPVITLKGNIYLVVLLVTDYSDTTYGIIKQSR